MARRGSQSPTFEQVGAFGSTDGPQAAELAALFWGEALPWQRRVLDVMLARDAADKYRFHTVGISLPRQNGKSWAVRARCFYGLACDGEKVLYTCQHGDTADEMFKALSAPFEDEDNAALNSLLKAVRKTNGQQAIYLTNGGYIRFTTRTNSLARGKSYDAIIYDEAQELTRSQQAASLFAVSASAKHNVQAVYLGTPPDPHTPGEVFKLMHDRVHDGGAPDTAWMEWAADSVGDPFDRDRWYACNPSLGALIDETAVEGEANQTAPDTFARERLGWWDMDSRHFEAAIPADKWEATAIDPADVPQDGRTCFGVKFAPEGDRAAVAGCVIPDGGEPFIELVDEYAMPAGLARLADWLADPARLARTAEIAIDGKAYSAALAAELSKRNVKPRMVRLMTADGVCAAASMLVSRVEDGTVHRVRSDVADALTVSALGAAKRTIGANGGWGLGDGSERSHPVEAASLALFADETTRRRPGRRMTVW